MRLSTVLLPSVVLPSVVLPMAASLLLLSSCEFSCNVGKDTTAKVQSWVEGELAKSGVVATVTCPKLKNVDSATCDAKTAEGVSFPIAVTHADDGDWSYKTEGVAFASQVEDVFKKIYADKYGLVLEKITCPKVVKLGTEAVCDGLDQGVKIPFDIMFTQKDGRNDLDFRPKSGILIVAKLEAAILAKGKEHGITKVDCGKERLMVSVPKKLFECGLFGAEGLVGKQKVLITNDKGGVEFL